jgi:predicted nucleic acid-binding protein
VIVLDASVLIAYLNGADSHHDRAERLLADHIDEEFGVNSLTLAEVLVAPTRAGRVEEVRRTLAELDVHELPFPAEPATDLARLRADTGLRMPDCCVLLAARTNGGRVAAFDEGLRKAALALGLELAD